MNATLTMTARCWLELPLVLVWSASALLSSRRPLTHPGFMLPWVYPCPQLSQATPRPLQSSVLLIPSSTPALSSAPCSSRGLQKNLDESMLSVFLHSATSSAVRYKVVQ